MAQPYCPVCQHDLSGGPPPVSCPACGFDLANPPPQIEWVVGKIDLRTVAKRQRMLIWYVLASLVTNWILPGALSAIHPALGLLALALMLGTTIVIVIGVVNMMAALRMHMGWRILYIILLFAPCINLLVLLAANQRATRALQKAGLRVGLMGVKDDQVVRFLGHARCRECGYSLIGNVSGRCPECGTPCA